MKLRECKTVEELCSGRCLYDVANDETYKSTHTMSREFRNLKVHIKTHFENELHMDNVHEREREI